MDKEQELLPCPWCNSAAQPPMYSAARWFCRCTKCGTNGPSFWQGGPNATDAEVDAAKSQAIAAWNRRSSSDEQRAEVVAWQVTQYDPNGRLNDASVSLVRAALPTYYRTERWGSSGHAMWEVIPLYASPSPAVATGGVTEALRNTTQWLKAALNCKDWHWDWDQRVVASADLDAAETVLASLAVRDEGMREGEK